MSLILWLHINQGVTLIDPGNIKTCIHLLIKFYSYLPIHVHWCWISAAFINSSFIRNCQIFIFNIFYSLYFLKSSKNKIVLQYFLICLISVLTICWRLNLLGLNCIWTFVIRSLNLKWFISSINKWIWSTDKHLVVLKEHLVLLQLLEYSCTRNLKKSCNDWLIDLTVLIQNLLNSVLWYWRAAWVKSLDEPITHIKWSSLRSWLVYK